MKRARLRIDDVVALLATVALLARPSLAQRVGGDPSTVRAVSAVGMTVSDLDRSVRFYTEVLAFEKVSEVEAATPELERLEGVFGSRVRVARLRLGHETLELTEYLAPRGRPIPTDSRSHDHWFQHVAIIVRDMDAAYARLRQSKVEHASSGPQTLPEWNRNAAGIRAFYFRDPDGHNLEILQFPGDKGDRRWHAPSDDLFLGIDHTAIVVEDTDASLRFYEGALGLRVAGTSENYGTEQEHLNSVFGARLRITTLRAPSGPGIEFLEYVSPSDGRATPSDLHSNDVAHWQTTLACDDLDRVEHELRARHFKFISPGIVSLPDAPLGFEKALSVMDPDGHVMQLVQPRSP